MHYVRRWSNAMTNKTDEISSLKGRIVSNYEILEKLSSDDSTVTYSARDTVSRRESLRITVRATSDAAAADEFVRVARERAKMEGLGSATLDVGVSDDGSFMFIVFDPKAQNEMRNPTMEQSIILSETVLELKRQSQDKD
jgi:hypothetical protein